MDFKKLSQCLIIKMLSIIRDINKTNVWIKEWFGSQSTDDWKGELN